MAGNRMQKKGQGAFEYVLLLAGVLLVVIVVVALLRGGLFVPVNQTLAAGLEKWSQETLVFEGQSCSFSFADNGSAASVECMLALTPNDTVVMVSSPYCINQSSPLVQVATCVFNGSFDVAPNMSFSQDNKSATLNFSAKYGGRVNVYEDHYWNATAQNGSVIVPTTSIPAPTPSPSPSPSPAPPGYSSQGQNASTPVQGQSVKLFVYWTDDVGLSTALLATNESGAWENKSAYGSPLILTGTSAWSNFTWNNASVAAGTIVGWRVYANDSSNNWNTTPVMQFAVQAPDYAPSVSLIAPADGATVAAGVVVFNFTPLDDRGFSSATLYGNFTGMWAANQSNQTTVANASSNSITTTLASGYYVWNVLACDNATPAQCVFAAQNRSLAVIFYIPIQTCQTIVSPGNYIVSQNLSTSTSCINISTSNVLLDCQNNEIVGAQNGVGISMNSVSDITLENCVIRNFSTGVSASNSNRLLLKNLVVKEIKKSGGSATAKGIEILGSSNTAVQNTTVIDVFGTTGGSGITGIGYGYGFFLTGSNFSLSDIKIKKIFGQGAYVSTSSTVYGIYLSASNSTISNAELEELYYQIGNYAGAYVRGVYASGSSNKLDSISITNTDGSYAYYSNNFGFELSGASNNSISNLMIYGIVSTAIGPCGFCGGGDTYNLGGIALTNSQNNSFENVSIRKIDGGTFCSILYIYSNGVSLSNSHNNSFKNLVVDRVAAKRCGYGDSAARDVFLSNSNNNTLVNSIFHTPEVSPVVVSGGNVNQTIYISGSSNLLYNNVIYDYNIAVTGANYWNASLSTGTNIMSGSKIGGNAWFKDFGNGYSQTCLDGNADDICDSPYNFYSTETDYLPLKDLLQQKIEFIYPTPENNSLTTSPNVSISAALLRNGFCILEWNGVNESMSGGDRFWSINKTSLSYGTYTYKAYCNSTVNPTFFASETRTIQII